MRLRMQILAYVNRVRDVEAEVDNEAFTLEQVESNPVRCPDPEAAQLMYKGTSKHPTGIAVNFVLLLSRRRGYAYGRVRAG
jgi:hypothetical protein